MLCKIIYKTNRPSLFVLEGVLMSINHLLADLPLEPAQLNLIFLGVSLFFVGIAALWGLIRGLKKTTFRGIWLVVTGVILFFVTPLITSLLFDLNISSLNLEFQNIQVVTIKQAVTTYIEASDFAAIAAANPVVFELIEKLPQLILNVFVFVILFWLVKILLWPVWAIIAATAIKKKTKNGEKMKKHRLGGLLVGAVIGLFVGSVTLMPIVNFINLAAHIERETAEYSNSGGLITDTLGSEIGDYILNFNKSEANFYNYTGFGQLSAAMFAGLTTVNINGVNVTLKGEVTNAIVAYKLVTDLMETDFDNLTEPQINAALTLTDNLIDAVFGSGLLQSISSDFIPYVIDKLLEDDFYFSLPTLEQVELQTLMVGALTEFKEVSFTDLKNDLKELVKLAKVLNDNHVILQTLALTQDDNLDEIELIAGVSQLLPETVVNQVFNHLFNMKTSVAIVPLALDAAFELAASSLNVTSFELGEETVTAAQLKTMLSNILNLSISAISTIDFDSEWYVTEDTFPYLGQLIDTIISYPKLTQQAYTTLMTAASNKLVTYVSDSDLTDSLPTSIVQNITNVIQNLPDITDFTSEFEFLANVYTKALAIYNSYKNDEEIEYALTGQLLNSIKTSTLFEDEFESIIKNAIDYATTLVPAEYASFAPIFTGIKNNVSAELDWEEELLLFEDFVTFLFTNIEDPDFLDNILTSGALGEIGELLNDLKASQLIGNQINNIVAGLLNFAIDSVLTPEQVQEYGTLLTTISNNITNAGTSTDWQVELNHISTLMGIIDGLGGTPNIPLIGAALDSFNGSVIISRPLVNAIVVDFLTEFIGSDPSIPSAITNAIIAAVPNVNSFATELTALLTFMDTLEAIMAATDMEDINLIAFGGELDNYNANNPQATNPSVLVTSVSPMVTSMVFDMLINELSELAPVLTNMKANALAQLTATVDPITYTNAFTQVMSTLQTAQQLSSINESFNPNDVGSIFNTLQSYSIVGLENSRMLAISVINEFVDYLTYVRSSYSEGTLEYIGLTMKIDALNTEISDLAALSTNADYIEVFTNVRNILDA